MWALAPSQAADRADSGGVPSRSVIRSSCSRKEVVEDGVTKVQGQVTLGVPGPAAHLLDGALRLEEDAAAQQLGEDAAHRPDVDGRAIVAAAHQHLRRPVVLRHHLLGHVTRRVGLLNPGQAEVADLQQAVAVDQQVARFDVPVQDAG